MLGGRLSHAFTTLGETRRAYVSQERALELSAPTSTMTRTLLNIDAAACSHHDGDTEQACRCTVSALTALPADCRTGRSAAVPWTCTRRSPPSTTASAPYGNYAASWPADNDGSHSGRPARSPSQWKHWPPWGVLRAPTVPTAWRRSRARPSTWPVCSASPRRLPDQDRQRGTGIAVLRQAKKPIERVRRILPADPSRACQRLLNGTEWATG